MRCPISLFFVALILFATHVSNASAQFPTIQLHTVSQPAFQIGSREQLELEGSRLDEVQQLVFSGSGITASPRLDPPPPLREEPVPSGAFTIEISKRASPGLVEVRASGRFGLSNPRTILLTSKPVIPCPRGNMDLLSAVAIDPSTIFADRATPRGFKTFRVSLKQGQHLRVVVYASQLDSRMIPLMLLSDSRGRELRRQRAIRRWPAEIEFQAEKTDEYLLSVADFLYQGGPEYSFLLECMITEEEATSEPAELDRLLRPTLGSLQTQEQQEEAGPENGLVQPPPGRFRNVSRLRASTSSRWTETESQPASSVDHQALPFTVIGDLAPGPVSHDFVAEKGQSLWLDVQSAQWDQLTDTSLILYQRVQQNDAPEEWKHLVHQDDADLVGGPEMRMHMRDPYLPWTVPEDGTYRLVLRDFEGGERPSDSVAYRLQVRGPTPTFSILAHHRFPNLNREQAIPSGISLMRGGTTAIMITAIRQDGFNGPIQVSIDNLPEGLCCSPAIIPPDGTETALIVQASEQASPKLVQLHVTGSAQIDGRTVTRRALAGTVVWGKTPIHNAITSRLTDSLYLQASDSDVAPVQVDVGKAKTLVASPGETIDVPIQVHRRTDEKLACLLRARHLPPKTSLADVKVSPDQQQAVGKLKINSDARPGDYTFWMLNETRVKWRANPQALERAEAYLTELKEALAALPSRDSPQRAELETAVENQQELVETLQKEAAPQDLTVWIPSTSVRLRVTTPQDSDPK